MRERDELDRLLDSALSTYGDPEAGSGANPDGADSNLERRILARIAGARLGSARISPAPRLRWLPWALGLTAAACLIFLWVATVKMHKLPSGAAERERQASQTPDRAFQAPTPLRRSASNPKVAGPEAKVHSTTVASAAKAAPLPKLDVFPTPEPLTPEEQALAAIVVHTPTSELEALMAAQEQEDTPQIRIAAIEVKPFEPPPAGAN
jgi:hypothetical protein